jgi:hypothetical protein
MKKAKDKSGKPGDRQMAKQILVQIDEENNAEQWWDAAREQLRLLDDVTAAPLPALRAEQLREDGAPVIGLLPGEARPLFASATAIELDGRVASELHDWCRQLPGWSDGPEHAKHPLKFHFQVPGQEHAI